MCNCCVAAVAVSAITLMLSLMCLSNECHFNGHAHEKACSVCLYFLGTFPIGNAFRQVKAINSWRWITSHYGGSFSFGFLSRSCMLHQRQLTCYPFFVYIIVSIIIKNYLKVTQR